MSEQTPNPESETPTTTTREPKKPYEPLTEAEIRDLAMGIHSEKIWTSQHCSDQESVHLSFMILSFAGEEIYQWIEANDITVVYESLDKACPMSVNGMPTFVSASFLSRDDWSRVVAKLMEIAEALAKV